MATAHLRLTVSFAMSIVIALAVGLAALRNANELWAGFMSLLSWALLGVALLGVIQGREVVRAWWLGYLVLAGGYSVLAFGPWFSEKVGPSLLTTRLLGLANMLVTSSPAPYSPETRKLLDQRRELLARLDAIRQLSRLPGDPAERKAHSRVRSVEDQITAIAGTSIPWLSTFGKELNPGASNRWRSLLPGAANYDQFLLVGHCLSSLLAGLFGAVISARFYRGRESQPGPDVGSSEV
jgi:hypothetical protein